MESFAETLQALKSRHAMSETAAGNAMAAVGRRFLEEIRSNPNITRERLREIAERLGEGDAAERGPLRDYARTLAEHIPIGEAGRQARQPESQPEQPQQAGQLTAQVPEPRQRGRLLTEADVEHEPELVREVVAALNVGAEAGGARVAEREQPPAKVETEHAARAIELAESPAVRSCFERDPSAFPSLLAVMCSSRDAKLLDNVRQKLTTNPELVRPRYTHGHIYDFYRKLSADPTQLTVLGDGRQNKSYLHIDDCVSAMLTPSIFTSVIL